MMRFFRLRTVMILAIVLILSSTEGAFAGPQVVLDPTCGSSGTLVSLNGSGFVGGVIHIYSSPAGLLGGNAGMRVSCC